MADQNLVRTGMRISLVRQAPSTKQAAKSCLLWRRVATWAEVAADVHVLGDLEEGTRRPALGICGDVGAGMPMCMCIGTCIVEMCTFHNLGSKNCGGPLDR